MRTDPLIILRVRKSSRVLNARGTQSKYFEQDNLFVQEYAHGNTDPFARAEKFMRVKFEGYTVEILRTR